MTWLRHLNETQPAAHAVGRQLWHMPVNTNLAFREFGIALLFAAVGLSAGPKFFARSIAVLVREPAKPVAPAPSLSRTLAACSRRSNISITMIYIRITILTVLVFATSGCHFLPDDLDYFFSSGEESVGHGASASEGDTSDEATLVISSLP